MMFVDWDVSVGLCIPSTRKNRCLLRSSSTARRRSEKSFEDLADSSFSGLGEVLKPIIELLVKRIIKKDLEGLRRWGFFVRM